MPHGKAAARQAAALEPPCAEKVVRHLAGKVLPEAEAFGGGPGVQRRADAGVMDVDVLGRVVRIGDGSQKELAEPAPPERPTVNQLVAHDEHRLRHHRHDYDH